MNRNSVNSDNLKSVGFDSSTNTLEIEFMFGCILSYSNVPESIYNGLMSDVSKGVYFRTLIKNAYPNTRIA